VTPSPTIPAKTSEMQERIAEEIMNTEREMRFDFARRWEDVLPELQTHYLMLALAAMKAMREPTPEMIEAGWNARGEVDARYRAMIDREISIAEGGKND